MTTETPSLPPPATGECHRGTILESQENSQTLQVENRDMAKNVVLIASPDNSRVPPLDGPLISFAEDTVVENPFPTVWKDGQFNESALAPLTSSETFKMTYDDQGQNGGHLVHQSKTPDTFLEPLKVGDTLSLSSQSEDGGHSACQVKIPEAFSEKPNPAEISAYTTEGEEGHDDTHPVATTESLKQSQPSEMPSDPNQGGQGNPCVYYRDTSEVWSEQQKSDSTISSQRGIGEESWGTDCHRQTPGTAPVFPERPEVAGGHREATYNVENSQDHLLLPSSLAPLLQGADSPSQTLEGSSHIFPGHDPSAEPQGTFYAADSSEGLKPGGHEVTEMGAWERVSGGQQQPGAPGKVLENLQGQLLEETSEDNSQVLEEKPVAQDSNSAPVGGSQALALTDPRSISGTCCQQRAAGTGCNMFPEAVAPLSPATTSDSLGPAHGGLAAGGDKEGREGPDAPESRAAGSKSQPLGEAAAEAVLESQRGEEAAGETGPEGTVGEPVGAEFLATEVPSLESGTGLTAEDPSGTMVLAYSGGSLNTRHKEVSHDSSGTQYLVSSSEQAGPKAKTRGGLLQDSKAPGDTEDPVNATDPVCSTPILDELSEAGGPHCSTDWMENDAANSENHCPETPIEREIRLHLEREELLRQQRGLASSWGPQEYVEVWVRPILSQSGAPSPLPKEKERQWAGAQMQREIQRECQREEDLVQLGKVRGAYDRGTPQELQEKKMLFEQQAAPDTLAPTKPVSSSSEGARGRSFAEADNAASPGPPASGALLQPLPERPSTANPFFCLRAKSPQSLLEQEIQEAQERERELQRQRHKLYGSALPRQPEEASDQDEEVPLQTERPPCKKLDVTWPPPSPSELCQVNGLHQLERSPRSRQRSALIQRWESGTVGNQESQD